MLEGIRYGQWKLIKIKHYHRSKIYKELSVLPLVCCYPYCPYLASAAIDFGILCIHQVFSNVVQQNPQILDAVLFRVPWETSSSGGETILTLILTGKIKLLCALIKLQSPKHKQQYSYLERLWNKDFKSDFWGRLTTRWRDWQRIRRYTEVLKKNLRHNWVSLQFWIFTSKQDDHKLWWMALSDR
jgi:hypothetical protein